MSKIPKTQNINPHWFLIFSSEPMRENLQRLGIQDKKKKMHKKQTHYKNLTNFCFIISKTEQKVGKKNEEKRGQTNRGGDISLLDLKFLEPFEKISSNPYGA